MNLDKIISFSEKYKFDIKENEPMKYHTSFKIGGNAQLLISVNTYEGLKELLKLCKSENVPVFILGKGSNILVSDKGIEGVVIKLDGVFKNISLVDDDEIFCGAGVSLAKLCNFAYENSLSGLEFAWGIPGSAGGAAFMNAGAYGGNMSDVLVSCTHIDSDFNQGTFTKKELSLSYRHSIYSENNYIVTGLLLKLQKDSQVEIRNRMDDYMKRRKDKQPLDYPSAGSVFKRPEGYFAGTLIEQSGLKGYSIGGAKVSEKHAGFIINTGNASCNDVLNLVEYIQNTVKEKHGVSLECEIRLVGNK